MITITTILGGLSLFLYGMKIMSESLQNTAGDGLKNILWKATNNRFKGVITGFSITALIQSSSATTVMLVSFVNAGLLNLIQATGIVLGANIGTTVTGWLVALIGFKLKVKSLALPAIALGFFMRFLNKKNINNWGETLLGFGILFLGLSLITGAVKDLKDSETIINFMAAYQADGILSTLLVVGIGASVTMLIQSSSATMAMTMALAVNGLVDFQTSCALILGENIGTTITANIAAIGSSVVARRTAKVHLLFNIFGVIWVLLILKPIFLPLIDFLIPGEVSSYSGVADHMAAFHTTFNIANTLFFLPFIEILAKLAEKLVPDKGKKDENVFQLKYISTPILATPAININQARLEIKRMMEITLEMFNLVIEVFKNPKEKLGETVEIVHIKENHTDILEKEITNFLVKVLQHNITEDQSQEISIMLHRVNEIERIADHCESILKLLRRKYDNKIIFSDRARGQIIEISDKVSEFLHLISENITKTGTNIIPQADQIENRINELRKKMRKNHIERLNESICDVPTGLIFIDMLTSFEKIGDHSYNIAEGIAGLRIF